jgi:hypothetical protein
MYRKDNGQISIAEFISPFGKLDKNNRWVKKAEQIPWDRLEDKYASLFESDKGNVGKPVRMALGALMIKQDLSLSDEGTVQMVLENVYTQYFIGLHEFTMKAPFSSSSMVYFRKRLTAGILAEIGEMIFAPEEPGDDGIGGDGPDGEAENEGTLILDATCAPADITYPTDVGLLGDAREKLERIVDILHPHTGQKRKVRTYRRKARRDYLRFVKRRRNSKQQIRQALRQQLGYVRRNLGHVDLLLEKVGAGLLPARYAGYLGTIRSLYEQQRQMYQTKTHQVADRIVSISQPHVRPMVRGKKNNPVEFGAKVSISMVGGYAFIDKIGWDNYSEAGLLPQAIENYRKRFGRYPKAVLADKLYRNRENLHFCKLRGIRLSGPRLGRPLANTPRDPYERPDSAARNAVEGKFGEGKTGYGLDRIMARLKETSETVISIAFLCMNLNRKLRSLLLYLFYSLDFDSSRILCVCSVDPN